MISNKVESKLPRVGAGLSRERPFTRSKRARTQAVEMEQKRFGYFPQRFKWHGKSYTVLAVERCWTRDPHLWFRVRCSEGVFDLAQNVRLNLWEVSLTNRVP